MRHKSRVTRVAHNKKGDYALLKNPLGGNRDVFLYKHDVTGQPRLEVGMLLEYELLERDDGSLKALDAKVMTIEMNTRQNVAVARQKSHSSSPKTVRLSEGEVKVQGNSYVVSNQTTPENNAINKTTLESPYSISPEKAMKVEFDPKQKKFWQIEPEPRLSLPYQSRFSLPYKSRYSQQNTKPERYPPYHFVPVAKKQNADEVDALLDTPVFHDGKQKEVYSGELRCTLTALTPLLVANDQYLANEVKEANVHNKGVDLPDTWKVKSLKDKDRNDIWVAADKSVLEPLRLPDGRVLISGASLKGMLRQSMTALLVAPMERVAERTYSYRLNTKIIQNDAKGKRYQCYPAIVEKVDNAGIPLEVKLLKKAKLNDVKYKRQNAKAGDKELSYVYGLDNQGILLWAHEEDDSTKRSNPTQLKRKVWIPKNLLNEKAVSVPDQIQAQYKATIEHLSNRSNGHLTGNHQLLRKISSTPDELSKAIKNAGKMTKDQLIYVEVIEEQKNDRITYRITSLGHNFRYRWRYADTVRTRWNWNDKEDKPEPQKRSVLQPVAQEKGDCPKELSAGRLLFGYVADDEGTAGMGKDHFSRLAGRIALNMAVENKEENVRFLNEDKACTVPLKELGEPRPSAVEFYLQQDGERPDRGSLVTYGDVADEDQGGELNGRKFYLHQPAAADLKNKDLYETRDDEVKASNQASLARFVSVPKTQFRFSLRFRDLRLWELGALLTTLEPEYLLNNIAELPDVNNLHQYATSLKNQALTAGQKSEHYPLLAHKLGHGRPLGLGSVRIAIDEKVIADSPENISLDSNDTANDIAEKAQTAFMEKLKERIDQNPQLATVLKNWLGVHQFRGQVQSAYPEHFDKEGEFHIYEFHTALRQRHARNRQFEKPNKGKVRKETLVLPELETVELETVFLEEN
jgi:CRISPR-associated protein (TIGR03986 family)